MATQLERRPPVEGPSATQGVSAQVTPPAYPQPSYPQPYPPAPAYPPYPASAPPPDAQVEAERTEQKWAGRCLALVIVSLALFIPLLGIAQGIASQYAVGFGGLLAVAAIPALLLAVVDVAFMVVTRPRR